MNDLPLIIVIGGTMLAVGITLGSIARALLTIRDAVLGLQVSLMRVAAAIDQQSDFRKNILGH